jgi:urease beta subunit
MRTKGRSQVTIPAVRTLFLFLLTLFAPKSAHATASFSCATDEKNIPAISFEGHAPYSGSELLNFSGEIEIEAGRKIALAKSDVKKFVWKKTMAFGIRKRIEPGAAIEIEIRTRKSADGIEFPGRYKIHTGKRKLEGKIACSGG